MTNRPALRAAIVVSGLSLTAACGGTATLRDREPTNGTTTTTGSANGSTTTGSSNGSTENTTASGPSCDPNVEPTTAECCDERNGRAWDAASSTCWMPGPFVPPTLIG